ncbi:S1C family serine protease [Lignipirellula cremea]|uniref:Periplasmic pH-dependent serine endoprotease DegQ n=1 Tax=Lignipirellula cremea TaxID=2528010 RepID=A0A518DXB3_9BACT|nr:PDZ domain-containing protein [Lignipirellula cremea]QDU96472.1 Periplasmic pH-dependent serine endoprotease DegQ precursor [Lignipirellula cremea]
MNMSIASLVHRAEFRRTCILSMVLCLSLGGASFASAQRVSKNERNHRTVLTAFRDVVATPKRSTVIVINDGKPAALGAIVDTAGYIITKASELHGALVCELDSGEKLPAELLGVHRETDLALLKIEAKDLPVIQWRTADEPLAGSWLATPGPGELPISIGVVGAISREIEAPSGILGILLDQDDKGPRIDQVMPGSGAERAGLLVNDIVTMVNGQLVKTREELIRYVRTFQPGEILKLKVLRNEKSIELAATLGNRSMFDESDKRRDFQNSLGGDLSERRTGFPAAIEHDSVLRPQDCGGPLVDLDGKAVGINIARAGRVSTYSLPASVVLPLIKNLKKGAEELDVSIWRKADGLALGSEVSDRQSNDK